MAMDVSVHSPRYNIRKMGKGEEPGFRETYIPGNGEFKTGKLGFWCVPKGDSVHLGFRTLSQSGVLIPFF